MNGNVWNPSSVEELNDKIVGRTGSVDFQFEYSYGLIPAWNVRRIYLPIISSYLSVNKPTL